MARQWRIEFKGAIYHILARGNQRQDIFNTRRFNLRHKQDGHLFQGRFKSILVENDTYLQRLSYYNHRNPLRAGIVNLRNTIALSSIQTSTN